MNTSLLHEVRRQSRKAFPTEASGVILRTDSGLELRPSLNRHPDDLNGFDLDPELMLNSYRDGKVAFIYHSHPDVPEDPSPTDEFCCNHFQVPYLIYSCLTDRFKMLEPVPRWSHLLGLEWNWGEQDCMSLVEQYYESVHFIKLPRFPRPEEDGFPQYDIFRRYAPVAGFRSVDEPPRRSDVLLIKVASKLPNHVAVYLGDGFILHHLVGAPSCRDEYQRWERFVRVIYRHGKVRNS